MGQKVGPRPENGEILLASEIARWLRVGISTVYQWAHGGTIPCVRLNGVLRFPRQDIEAWLTAHRMPASQGADGVSQSRATVPSLSMDLLRRTARHVLRETPVRATIQSASASSPRKKQS
jgi:excisionase family DNA binding protein